MGSKAITVLVTVDVAAWAEEYCIDPADTEAVVEDAASYVLTALQESSAGNAKLITQAAIIGVEDGGGLSGESVE